MTITSETDLDGHSSYLMIHGELELFVIIQDPYYVPSSLFVDKVLGDQCDGSMCTCWALERRNNNESPFFDSFLQLIQI